jgi:hypothetical protein
MIAAMTTSSVEIAIPIPYDAIATFCERHHIARLWLFGSVLRDDFDADSDVDVLVEFEANHPTTLLHLAAAQRVLGKLLNRRVDLSTSGGLSPYIHERVMRSRQVIYERT